MFQCNQIPQANQNRPVLHYPSYFQKISTAETCAYTADDVNLLSKLALYKLEYKALLKSCRFTDRSCWRENPSWETSNHTMGVYLGWDLTRHFLVLEIKFHLQFLAAFLIFCPKTLVNWMFLH